MILLFEQCYNDRLSQGKRSPTFPNIRGSTNRLVINIVDEYRKVNYNFNRLRDKE